MWFFYVMAFVPVVIGFILWLRNPQINLWEWVGGSAIGFLMAGMFQMLALYGMTDDRETWSGSITATTHWPRWVEEYQQMHTREYACGTDSNGNTTYCTEIYYTTEYRTHPEHWTADTSIPDDHEISESFYQESLRNFGGKVAVEQPYKGGFYSGDKNTYVAYNNSGFCYPVTATFSFVNKIKAAPTVFSFIKVPTNITVYAYPTPTDWRQSNRLLGTAASTVSILEFDRLNARLGARKKVNLIMVGFGTKDRSYAEYQQAKWIGGKKNDLVLCYGGDAGGKPAWAKVFGWTDSDVCKKIIEGILLENKVDDSILEKIEKQVVSYYTIKDWSSFDYIKIEPPMWSYFVYLFVLIGSQTGFYIWAYRNQACKQAASGRWHVPWYSRV